MGKNNVKPKPSRLEKMVRARACPFCKDKKLKIDYKDTNFLRKYLTERGKIRSRRVTGICVQHQRDIAVSVKNSREVALLPFISLAK